MAQSEIRAQRWLERLGAAPTRSAHARASRLSSHSSRREAAARLPRSAAKVAAAVPGRAIAAAAGRCTAAPAAADRSAVSPGTGGVRAEHRPHASACRAAAQPHHLRRSRALVPGSRSSGRAGGPASPRGGLGRPGAGRAMRPCHVGDSPEARDPLVGRLWSLVCPHVRREVDFKFIIHTSIHRSCMRHRRVCVKLCSPVLYNYDL